jgi:hypothetical protein
MNDRDVAGPARIRLLPAVVAAWLVCLVCDFLTHGVLLAGWWRATGSYWLPPRDLFRLIPLGYASFAIGCAALAWLLGRIYGGGLSPAGGLRFGAIVGLVSGVGSVLGAYSVFRMPPSALLVWPASITLDLAVAGLTAAWVGVAARPWRRVAAVFGAALILFLLGVVLQNTWFPTPAADRVR